MGSEITRRGFLGHTAGAFVFTGIVGGTAVAVSDMRELHVLEAYSQWLFYERRFLQFELHGDFNAETYVLMNTIAQDFHLPTTGDWRAVPKPSARAGAILHGVGIDLSRRA